MWKCWFNIIFGYQTSVGSAITYGNAIQSIAGTLGFFASGYSTGTPALAIGNSGNVSIYSTDSFNINFSTANSSWANFALQPTSLWGDGLTTASEYGGTKFLTMRQVMFSNPHVTPWGVGQDATIRMGMAGGIQAELDTLTYRMAQFFEPLLGTLFAYVFSEVIYIDWNESV